MLQDRHIDTYIHTDRLHIHALTHKHPRDDDGHGGLRAQVDVVRDDGSNAVGGRPCACLYACVGGGGGGVGGGG